MRSQKKAPHLQSAHSSNKTAFPGWPGRRLQGPACQPAGARPRVRRYAAEPARNRLRRAPGQAAKSPERSTPMIALTLRAMNRTLPRGARAARSVVLLLSALVLVAFACFPVVAHAGSEVPEYETDVPTTTGHKHPPTHSDNPPGSDQSHSNGGAGVSNAGGSGPGSGSSSGDSSSGGPVAHASDNPGTANGGGNGQGSQGKGATADDGAAGLTQGQPVNSEASSSDGGSSPLVPILIAVAVLAAISIGAVVIRQKRQRPGSPFSPEAS
jgi:hypothetical protein